MNPPEFELISLCISILTITGNRFTPSDIMENLKNIKVTGEISLQPLEPVVTHTDLYTMTGPKHRVVLWVFCPT